MSRVSRVCRVCRVCGAVLVVGHGRAALNIGGIWCAVHALRAHGSGTVVGNNLGCLGPVPTHVFFLGASITTARNCTTSAARLALAAAHAHIAANANAATLFGNGPRQGSALGKARELLGAKNHEIIGLDLHAPVERLRRVSGTIVHILVEVGKLLCLLVQVESQAVAALVADRQIRE